MTWIKPSFLWLIGRVIGQANPIKIIF
ncbi:DUF4291 domain-containing protein [Acinetobacter bereziniae]|nr:DUF4291 domain-containing protein [Acinetobacter bereziniae]